MPLDIQQMRDEIRDSTGTEEDELPDTKINLNLNRSFWEIMDKFPFREKEKTGEFDTQRGVRVYHMPPRFEYLNSLSISSYGLEVPKNIDGVDLVEDLNYLRLVQKLDCYHSFNWGQHKQLDQVNHNVYETYYNENPDYRAKPKRYTRENCYAKLEPVPDKIYKITIKRNIILDDLNDNNNIPVIPQAWHEIIMFGGMWRSFIGLGDLTRANHIKAHQVSLTNTMQPVEAKEEGSNTQLAGVQAPGRDY